MRAQLFNDARQVGRTDNCDDLVPFGLFDVVRHVGVTLIDQDILDRRQHLAHFFEHCRKGIGLAQFGQFFLVQLLRFEHAGKQNRQQVHFFPEAGFAPGAQ